MALKKRGLDEQSRVLLETPAVVTAGHQSQSSCRKTEPDRMTSVHWPCGDQDQLGFTSAGQHCANH